MSCQGRAFLVLILCLLLAPACGRERTAAPSGKASPAGNAASGGGEDAGAVRSYGQGAPEALPAQRLPGRVTLRVNLKKASDGSPVPASQVILFVQATADPRSLSTRKLWTDRKGAAVQVLKRAHRAALLTEFARKPLEIPLTGEEVEMTLNVATPFLVRGRVIDPAGRPVPGASVFFRGADTKTPFPPLPESEKDFAAFERRHFHDFDAHCRTGEDGRFTAKVDFLRQEVAAAFHAGFAPAGWRYLSFPAGEDEYTPVEIVLRPAGRLDLLLLSALKKPVSGCPVRIRESLSSESLRRYRERICAPFSRKGVSGPDGKVSFSVPAGIDLVLEGGAVGKPFLFFPGKGESVAKRDFTKEKGLDEARVAPGETLVAVAVPPPKARLAVTVRDAAGDPLPGASVILPRETVRTGEGGKVSLVIPYGPAGGGTFRVEKEGFRSRSGTLPPLSEKEGRQVALDVVLKKAPLLAVDAGPSARAVWLVKKAAPPGALRVAGGAEPLAAPGALARPFRTEKNRRLFHESGAGPFALLVQRGVFFFQRVEDIPSSGGTVSADTGAPGAGASLSGRIRLPEGALPQSVTVTILRNDLPWVRRYDPRGVFREAAGWAVEEAAPDGTFRFSSLAPGRYALCASLVEWWVRTDLYGEVTVPKGAGEVSVELGPTEEEGSLEFRVAAAGGGPLPGASLLLLDPVDSPIASSAAMGPFYMTGDDGRIVVDRLPPGRYGFIISSGGSADDAAAGRVLVEGGRRAKVLIAAGK